MQPLEVDGHEAPLPRGLYDALRKRRPELSLKDCQLVGNALRHTPPGGCVSLRATAADGAVRAEVCDTGCGIAAADLPRIFDRFYRGRDGKGSGSTGLGLYLVRELALANGGSVRLGSSKKGARFVLELPLMPIH